MKVRMNITVTNKGLTWSIYPGMRSYMSRISSFRKGRGTCMIKSPEMVMGIILNEEEKDTP